MPIILDFESQSAADLTVIGGRNYWAHPTTRPLCCVLYDTDAEAPGLWLPGMPCPFGPDDVLVAHNGIDFDRHGCARLGWRALDEGPPWHDSSELARRAGLPGALDALATRWLGLAKNDAGTAVVKALSSLRVCGDTYHKTGPKAGTLKKRGVPAELIPSLKAYAKACKKLGAFAPVPANVLDYVVTYCALDVEILVHGWPQLAQWIGDDTDRENDVLRVDRAINERGIGFDTQLARRLLEEDGRNAEIACERVAQGLMAMGGSGWTAATVREAASSPEQFAELTGAENAQAETVETMRLTMPGTEAALLCEARQAIASIARGKLEAGLARVSPDGRLRDMLRYYGAHTGRWSHRAIQLGNMPRPTACYEKWSDEDVCRLADAVLAGEHCTQDDVDLLLRACLVARPGHTFAVCDFSGVEARDLAWRANDRGALRVFGDKALDVYKVAAAAIYGIPYADVTKSQRQAGKVAELACGYQGGAGALTRFAIKMGIDLEGAGVDPAAIVKAWRKLHAPVVRFWRDVERAWGDAAGGREASVSDFTFMPVDGGVAVMLPSGRPIMYPEARITRGSRGRPSLAFLGKYGVLDHTYGGKLVENIIQAECRDFLADAVVRVEDAGLCPVLTVHDEIVAEVWAGVNNGQEGYVELERTMLTLPAWGEGFPVGAAGHTGRRYRK